MEACPCSWVVKVENKIYGPFANDGLAKQWAEEYFAGTPYTVCQLIKP